jgi:predicted transcriptional regulator
MKVETLKFPIKLVNGHHKHVYIINLHLPLINTNINTFNIDTINSAHYSESLQQDIFSMDNLADKTIPLNDYLPHGLSETQKYASKTIL